MSPRRCRAVAVAASMMIGVAGVCEAQVRRAPREPRSVFSISGGIQSGSSLTDTFTFEQYAEDGTVRAEYPGTSATFFEVSAGTRIWRRIGIGAAVTRSSSSGDVSVSADVPHPFFLDQPRSVEGSATDLSRDETGVHVQLYWEPRMTGRLRVRLFAGPSFIDVKQDLVEGVDLNEVYPYDETTFRSARTRQGSGSAVGGHGGADLSWMLSRQVGAGVLVRYAAASVDLNAPASRTVSSDAGGLQAAAGIRVVF
jgi:hypothetical protein